MSECDTDVLIWNGHEADLLRRMGAGERVNDQVDWRNIAAEIQALGRSDRRELETRISTILARLITLQAPPTQKPNTNP